MVPHIDITKDELVRASLAGDHLTVYIEFFFQACCENDCNLVAQFLKPPPRTPNTRGKLSS